MTSILSKSSLLLENLVPDTLAHYAKTKPGAFLSVLAAGSGALYWLLRRLQRPAKFREVPGLPFVGVLHKIPSTDKILEVFEKWCTEYGQDGVFEASIAGERTVFLCDWDLAQPVLNARPFKVRRPHGWKKTDLLSEDIGLFFAEGSQWTVQRRIVAPAFNVKAMESYLPSMVDTVGTLVKVLGEDAKNRTKSNMSTYMRRLNADTTSRVAFGQDFGALTRDTQELHDLMTLFDGMAERMFSVFPVWRVPFVKRWFQEPEQAEQRIKAMIGKFLENPVEGTILNKMVQAEGGKLSRSEVVGNVEVLFLAGTDTTSHTLSWAIYELAANQKLQDALAAEVRNHPVGVEGVQKLQDLRLCQAVWKESLRLHSVAPFLDLQNDEPVEVAGKMVPPGACFMAMFRVMCNKSPVFRAALGDDLDTFRPERWLHPDGGLVEVKHMDMLSFGTGARMCVGKLMANTMGPLTICEIVRHFRIAQWQGPPMQERTSFVICPAEDVKVHLSPRTD